MKREKTYLFSFLMKRLVVAPVFYLSIIGVFFTALLPALPDIQMEYEIDVRDVIYLFQFPFDVTSFSRIVPLLAALTAAACFAEDYNSRYLYGIVTRMKVRQYTTCRFSVCATAGFLTVLLGWTIYIGSISAFYPMVNMAAGNYQTFCDRLYGVLLYHGHPVLYMMVQVIGLAISGAFWAAVGLAISAYAPNRYLAIASPFLINDTLYNLTNDLHWWFSPSNVAKGLELGGNLISFTATLLYFGALLLLLYILFHIGVQRRLCHA